MPDFSHVGKLLLIAGVMIAAAGGLILLAGKFPWLGRLPGDIFIKGARGTFYFPLATCIVVSVLLTVLFSLFRK